MDQQYGGGYTQPPPIQPESKGKGCLFWGCITVVVLGLVGGLAAVGIGYFAFTKIKELAEKYTETAPREIQQVEISGPEMDALTARMEAFGASLRGEAEPATLVLTEAELNAIIQKSEIVSELGMDVYVDIDEGQLKGEMSWAIPAEMPMVGGRYFNASADFLASVQFGMLQVFVQRAEVKGEEVPEEIMSQIRSENFAAGMYEPHNRAEYQEAIDAIEKIASFEIGEDTLTLVPQMGNGDVIIDNTTDMTTEEAPVEMEDAPVEEMPVEAAPVDEAPVEAEVDTP